MSVDPNQYVARRKHAKRAPATGSYVQSSLRRDFDWSRWEVLARTEADQIESVAGRRIFDDEARMRIFEAFDLVERFKHAESDDANTKAEDIKRRIRDAKAKAKMDQPIEDDLVFDFVQKHTLSSEIADKSFIDKATFVLREIKRSPNDFFMDFPHPDAMAIWEIKIVFDQLGLPTTIWHNRPTNIEPGDEPLSVFEQFVFSTILMEHMADASGRMRLRRRIMEAQRAVERSEL